MRPETRVVSILLPLLALLVRSPVAAETRVPEMADGRALVRAMHARYDGHWYRDFMLVQDVTYFRDGAEERTEQMAEYLALPGRVRAVTRGSAAGNAEIYVDGAFHRFEDGAMTSRMPTVHGVLLLGFDVYAQAPETSIAQLEELGVDLDRITESSWQGRPGWVVGAAPGDSSTPQFWVEKDRLLCWRVLSQRPYGTLDVEMAGWKPLDDGWIATELTFKRNGVLALRERLRRVPHSRDPRPRAVRRDRAPDHHLPTLIRRSPGGPGTPGLRCGSRPGRSGPRPPSPTGSSPGWRSRGWCR